MSKRRTRSQIRLEEIQLTEKMESLELKIDSLVKENKELKQKVMESLESADFLNQKYEEYNADIKVVKEKLNMIVEQNNNLVEKNKALENQIKEEKEERLKLEEKIYMIINPIEIERRSKNLELHGVHEKENENCKQIVNNIITQVIPGTVNINEAYRFGQKFKNNGERKVRPLLIQFENKETRDKVYDGRANLKKIENEKLYLNENLPANLKILRGKANHIRKEKDYKFIWVKNGTILLRKSENTNAISIKKTF